MKLNICVFCGREDDLHHHHVVPRGSEEARACGVSDEFIESEYNLITVCTKHHNMIHGIRHTMKKQNFSQLVKDGQAKGIEEGRFPGRPRMEEWKRDKIYEMYDNGAKWEEIHEVTGCAARTISKCLHASGRILKRNKRKYNPNYWDGKADKWMEEEQARLSKPKIKKDFSDMPLLS